ncbi:MAG: hypothetical protein JNL88_11940 [Bacteroidia bacterium]|nr:hypothetical protein [Bacteroidia bacterium]
MAVTIREVFEKGANKQGLSFAFCLLLAAFIWLINALNNTYSSSVSVPILYSKTNPEQPARNLPDHIHLEVRGKGFALWSFKRKAKGFSIHTEGFSGRMKDTVLDSRAALEPLLTDFTKTLDIEKLEPEQLIFSGRPYFSKKLAVRGAVNVRFKQPMVQSGPAVFYPDSINVFSGALIPDSLKTISVEAVTIESAEKAVFKRLRLKLPGKDFRSTHQDAWLYVPAEEGTEIKLEVPVYAGPLNDGDLYIPSYVILSCMVPLSKYNLTHPSRFRVQPAATFPEANRVPLLLSHAPYWASHIDYEPKLVQKLKKKLL